MLPGLFFIGVVHKEVRVQTVIEAVLVGTVGCRNEPRQLPNVSTVSEPSSTDTILQSYTISTPPLQE